MRVKNQLPPGLWRIIILGVLLHAVGGALAAAAARMQ